MKIFLAAAALATALAQPASAITFPTLTTIYVGSGVSDNGAGPNSGLMTAFLCSNVSGQSTTVRFLVLDRDGAVEANASITVPHGGTRVAVTHNGSGFIFDLVLATGVVAHGVVNIESTQSGVFCSAVVGAADGSRGYSLHLVRINGHPGAEE